MVAGNHQNRPIRQTSEELLTGLELRTLGPLRQIATHHNDIGRERWDCLQQCFSHRGHEWRSEMEIGYVQNLG